MRLVFQLAVFGNMYGLANMTLFLLLVNFIAALVGVQLLRGDLDDTKFINFAHLFNAFLGMYQIFTSENWTDVLYNTGQAEIALGQTVVVIIFLSSWYLFANCESHLGSSLSLPTIPTRFPSHHFADVHCCHQREL